ncbi:flagellar hook-length control protein FliK [Paenibacillus sp.]|uniref:flagellar hook-length control protein FliK n=1 Tax=Paenibacillus sp. TaxID=58172 RepID=UPI002D490DCA|nr:flagellar hook-length control protein FliK [Paenibacillus sp.]HZG84397.1 flagellar hook-length control protein FliK [Paenibacillus sp.]
MMNGVQTAIAGASVQTTAVAAISGGGAAGTGAPAESSGFAALIASLLGGSAMPAEGREAAMLGWLAGAALPEGAQTEAAEEDQTALDALLAEMSAWIASLTAEQQQQLANQPEVSEWMALANAELAMSALLEDVAPTGLNAATAQAGENGAAGAQPIAELWGRLAKALEADPNQPHLLAAAKQAPLVLAQAASLLAAVDAGAENAADGSAERGAAETRGGSAAGMKPAAGALAELLAKANGSVEAPKSEGARNANARWSHLSAMQAKVSLVRVTAVEAASTAAVGAADAAAHGADTAGAASQGEPILTSSAWDALKANATDAQPRAEAAAPRMTLPEATEQLKEWMLRQSSGGGDFKAETILKLKPEHLGEVQVKLTMQNGQLAATITTESAMAKDALESNLSALRLNLQSQGVTVERLVVSQQQPNGQPSGFEQEGRREQQAGREPNRDGRSREEQDAEDWAEVLSVTANLNAANLDVIGNSFRAEA